MLAQKRLQRDLESLQNDLKVLIHDAKEIGLEKLGAVEAQASEPSSEQFKEITKRAQETISNLREQFQQSRVQVESAVEKHPYAAIGTALGIGFVLGKLGNFRRSSNP
jgi:ElaB/YqjD/DUF883 family membrane-anchored ribosome-binding protein